MVEISDFSGDLIELCLTGPEGIFFSLSSQGGAQTETMAF